MMRIDVVSQSPKQVVLKIQGRLVDADVDLLEGEVSRWREQVEHLVVDLKGVQRIDRAGIALLRQWTREKMGQGTGTGLRLSLRDGACFLRTRLEAHGLTAR